MTQLVSHYMLEVVVAAVVVAAVAVVVVVNTLCHVNITREI
jgi:hypothetical protein